jgi:hypothetical protein
MKISLEPEFFGGQDIHQNSWNFKNFSVVTVPFLCRAIFFILLRRVILFELGIYLRKSETEVFQITLLGGNNQKLLVQ